MAEVKLPLLTHSDFVGDTDLELNTYKKEQLITLIDIYEKKYIRELLNDKAYIDLKAGIDSPVYEVLINGGVYQVDGKDVLCDGFKEALRYWIYYHYKATFYEDNYVNKNDNSIINSDNFFMICKNAWDRGVEKYKNVVEYILSQQETTLEYRDYHLPVLRIMNII